jgi:hypothetical protein
VACRFDLEFSVGELHGEYLIGSHELVGDRPVV